jgi:hypothetical protein
MLTGVEIAYTHRKKRKQTQFQFLRPNCKKNTKISAVDVRLGDMLSPPR